MTASLALGQRKRSARDYAIILLSYRHGLRCIELLRLRWEYVDWGKSTIKNHSKSGFIISGRQKDYLNGRKNFSTSRVRQICKEISLEANLSRPFHHHQLRHTCGHQMAENPNINSLTVQRYLGHKDAKSTEVYIREASRDFKRLGEWWKPFRHDF